MLNLVNLLCLVSYIINCENKMNNSHNRHNRLPVERNMAGPIIRIKKGPVILIWFRFGVQID